MGESLRLGVAFQIGVLQLIVSDAIFASKCFKYLQDNYFDTEQLSWFFSNFRSHYKKYTRLPDGATTLTDIDSQIKEDQRGDYYGLHRDIFGRPCTNTEYYKEHIQIYTKACMYKELWAGSKDYYNNQKFESAYNYTEGKLSEIRGVDFFGDDAVNMDDLDAILAKLHASNEGKIKTNMGVLDSLLVGGIPRKSVTTVMAGYNVGKTIFLINLAVEAARGGHRVLFVFHEGREEQIVARFLSKVSEIPYKYIINAKDAASEYKVPRHKLNEAREFIKKFVVIKPMVKVGTTIEDVYAYVKEKDKELKIDMLISDYAQRLEVSQRYTELRHNIAKIWQMLSQMAAELDMAVVTAAQFNREGVKASKNMKRAIRSDMVSECVDIAQISETIFTLNPFVNDSMVVCLDKQRDGRKGVLIKCRMDWETVRMWDRDLGIVEITDQEYEDHYDPEGAEMMRNKDDEEIGRYGVQTETVVGGDIAEAKQDYSPHWGGIDQSSGSPESGGYDDV